MRSQVPEKPAMKLIRSCPRQVSSGPLNNRTGVQTSFFGPVGPILAEERFSMRPLLEVRGRTSRFEGHLHDPGNPTHRTRHAGLAHGPDARTGSRGAR